MAIAHDAESTVQSWTTTPDPFTWTHTPVGTPRGVIVEISQAAQSTDQITAVTYGGETMARVATAADAAGEPCRTYTYFLGTGIPTGAQTVSVDHTAAATQKRAKSITITAATDTEIVDFEILEGDGTDPQVTLDSGADTAARYFHTASGQANVGGLTALSDQTAGGNADYGSVVWVSGRRTTPSSGSVTVGWTATTDDRAMVGIAIIESETNVLDEYGFATETDVAMPFEAATQIVDEYGFAAEADAAMPFTAATLVLDEYGFAAESDAAMPFEATVAEVVLDEYGFATETDASMPFLAATQLTDTFGFAGETSTAMPFTATAEEPPEESPEESPSDINAGFAGPRPQPLPPEWSIWHANRFGVLREQIPWVSFTGSPLRVVDNVSTITVVSKDDPTLLKRLKPWHSEIQLRLGERIVWAGPVTEVSYTYDADNPSPVTIVAADLLHWLSVRLLRRPIEPGRVSVQFQEILRRAMMGDNVGLEAAIPQPVGVRGDELATDITDALSEIMGLAPYLDFTMYGRELRVGKEEIPFARLPNLILPEHAQSFSITHVGEEEASQIFVRGGDDEGPPRTRIVNRYPSNVEREDPDIGLVQRLVSNNNIVNEDLAARTAQSKFLYSRPPLYVMTVTLGPRTPFAVEEVVAGSRINVDYPPLGIYGEAMRVRSVDLTVDQETETSALELIPLGIVTGHFVASVL